MDKRDAGFTLIELSIALAIVAVVAVGVVPALGDIMTRNRAATLTNEFLVALSYARSEAITRARPVTLCRMDSTAGQCTDANFGSGKCVCVTTTTASTADGWEDGWLTFIDNDGDGSIDTSENDSLLQVQSALGGGFTARGNSTAAAGVGDRITFEANGTSLGSNSAAIAICAAGSDATEGSIRMQTARNISIIGTGRARAMAFDSADADNCEL